MPNYAVAITRNLLEKIGENPSVLDWGADRHGVEDSTALLQAALDNCRGSLLIPPGEYKITGPLFVPAGVTMYGSDTSRCVIKVAAGSGPSSIWITNVSNVTLADFTFDCTETVSGIRIGTTDPATEDMRNIRLRGLRVIFSGNMTDPPTTFRHNIEVKKGIDLGDGTAFGIHGVWITDCVCENAAGDGIFGGDNLSVASYDVDGAGLVRDVYVSGCRFARAGRQNISIEGTGVTAVTKPSRVFLSNVTLEDSSLAGIDIEDADQVCLSNIVFVRCGAYEGYARHVDIQEATEMRSGLVLHGLEKQLTCTGLVFDHCRYGVSGYLHVKISNSKFINSYIFNGLASTAGRWEFSNCEFSSDDSALPLIKLLAPTATFVGCKFNYTGGASHMIWLQADSTYFGEVLFSGCVFEGPTVSPALDAISLQSARSLQLVGCTFKNLRKIITTTLNLGNLIVVMTGNTLRGIELIAEFGFFNAQEFVFSNNLCDELKGGFTFDTAKRVQIDHNVFLVRMNTGDGFSHTFLFTNPAQELIVTYNIAVMVGTAADSKFIRATSRDGDLVPVGPMIIGNKITGFNDGVDLHQFDSLYQYRGAQVVGNYFLDVPNPLFSIAGAHNNTFIQHDNVTEDTVINAVSQYLRNDAQFRIATASGGQFPPAMRMYADPADDGFLDATSGKLHLQVGAADKVTVDSSGRVSVNTTTVGGQMHVYVGAPTTPGLVVRGALAQTAPVVLIQKEDGSTLFLIESNGDAKAFGSFAPNNSASRLYAGTGTPEGQITAEIGSIYLRTDVNGIVYVKHSGSGNTGWRSISSSAQVDSVFGRVGVVVAQTGDYSFAQISGAAIAAQVPNIEALNGAALPAQVPNLQDLNGTLDIASGGTGATDAAGALANIGAAPAVHNHSGQNLLPDNVTLVNAGQLKIRKADGSDAPAAIRMYASGDNGFIDATAGILSLQVGAGTKVTLDGSGNMTITGNAVAAWHHAPNSGGFKIATNLGSFAPAAVRVYSDASNIAYLDATAGSFIHFQVGADTKATLDSSGNLVIDGALAMGTPLAVASGGTGSTSAAGARGVLGAAASGANADITSLSGLSTPLSVAQGGSGANSAAVARTNLGAAASGSNSDITALTGLTTPLGLTEGGTSASTAVQARTNLAAATKGGTGAQVTCPLAKITPGGLNGQIVFNADGVMINLTIPT